MRIADKGVIPAVVTPLNEDETIDVGSLERLVEWVVRHEIKGIFVAGSIGEGPSLRDHERARLTKETVRFVRGRVPVLASISDTGTVRIKEHLAAIATSGVDAVVLTPRIMYPDRNGDVLRMMEDIAATSPIPVWFYENPSTTPVTSTFDDLERIMALANIGGLKFSARDPELYRRCAVAFAGRLPIYNGNVPEIQLAAELGTGALVGIGGMLPGLCVRLWNAAHRGEKAAAAEMQDAINAVYDIYLGKNWPFWPSAQKHVLKRRGIFRTSIATAPFARLTPDQERQIDAVIERIETRTFDADKMKLS